MEVRFGIDLGGTKTEIIGLEKYTGKEVYRHRIATDRSTYDVIIATIAELVFAAEKQLKTTGTVGVGIPGSLHPKTQRIHNSNTTVTNDQLMGDDLNRALGREVRLSNDANCLTISEAIDGAGQGHSVVFGVIIGTGSGAGIAINGQLIRGRNGLAGEWAHNPLPFPKVYGANQQALDYFDTVGKQTHAASYNRKRPIALYTDNWVEVEHPGRQCYCGKRGCIETWLSGTGFAHDYQTVTHQTKTSEAIVAAMRAGDETAKQVFQRYVQRMAKSLAQVINNLDPDVIVLGGGMSNIEEIYTEVPRYWQDFIFAASSETPIVPAHHGDSSGVRGAAWLW